jgi:hypothetical protein
VIDGPGSAGEGAPAEAARAAEAQQQTVQGLMEEIEALRTQLAKQVPLPLHPQP